MIVCLLYGDYKAAAAYLAAVGILSAGGIMAGRLAWKGRIQNNEALVLAAASFLVAPMAAVAPFMMTGMSAVDAVFETISGVTTTGLTMLTDVQTASASLVFGRAWLQWYGGLGIVVFSLVLILRPGTVAKDIADTKDIEDDLLGGVKAFASRALTAYGVMTILGTILLLALGISPITAIHYALAAVSTGGFAPQNNSAAALGSWPAVRSASNASSAAFRIPTMKKSAASSVSQTPSCPRARSANIWRIWSRASTPWSCRG